MRRLIDLGRQFNLPLFEVMQWPQAEIECQLAYNLLQDPDCFKRITNEVEIEKQKAMTKDERWEYLQQKRKMNEH